MERAAALGADLMLSGHTHGGQLWPFVYLVGRVYPYVAGRYQVDGMTLLVLSLVIIDPGGDVGVAGCQI